nr:MAG TPA: helix-turn-helix domain protein [Caudoviricetes sp.]
MKNRIKQIRNSNPNWKSQDLFASFLGIPKANLSSYETGRRTPTDAVIQLICEKCSVNEEWLRTGNGDMFVSGIKDKQISAMLADVMKSGEDSFRHRLVSALARLDDEGWDNLEKLIDMISNK